MPKSIRHDGKKNLSVFVRSVDVSAVHFDVKRESNFVELDGDSYNWSKSKSPMSGSRELLMIRLCVNAGSHFAVRHWEMKSYGLVEQNKTLIMKKQNFTQKLPFCS